eukprot:454086-Hanusia_phi.AAC.2
MYWRKGPATARTSQGLAQGGRDLLSSSRPLCLLSPHEHPVVNELLVSPAGGQRHNSWLCGSEREGRGWEAVGDEVVREEGDGAQTRPSSTALTMLMKLSSASTIFAAPSATDVPLPIATPIDAALSAGASLNAVAGHGGASPT